MNRVGAESSITSDFSAAVESDGLVVPGVGAFAACVRGLRDARGAEVVERRLAAGRPVFGICVGMQIMFASGVEHGEVAEGLGVWPGTVEHLRAEVLPHMGWNSVVAARDSKLFRNVRGERFYFVHSYAVRDWSAMSRPEPLPSPLVTTSEHGERFVAAVEDGPLTATQFHPEKSGDAGSRLLADWLNDIR